MSSTKNILLAGLFCAGLYWVGDALANTYLFEEGRLIGQLFMPGVEDVLGRLFVLALCLGLGFYAQAGLARHLHGDEHKSTIDEGIAVQTRTLNEDNQRLAADNAERQLAETAAIEARDAAMKASRIRYEYFAHATQELRTPLNAVNGFSKILKDDILGVMSDRHRSYVMEILKAGEHMQELVDDMLDVANIESGRMSVCLERVEAGPNMDDIIELVEPLAAQRKVALIREGGELSGVGIQADEDRFKQVFRNLLANAVKASPEGSPVTIRTELIDGAVFKISIRDSSGGLSEDERRDAFMPFSQLIRQRNLASAGINLAIAKQLMDAMGGAIGIENDAARGATYWFCLPVHRTDTSSARSSAEPARPEDADALAPRILLVEDNRNNQITLRTMIERAGYQVEIAVDGRHAVQLSAAKPYDAILMDIRMPKMDGFEAAQVIREQALGEQALGGTRIPIIAMSADVLRVDKAACEAAGMDDFIAKPINKRMLEKTLGTWIQGRADATGGAKARVSHGLLKKRLRQQIMDHLSIQITPLTQDMIRAVIDSFLSEADMSLQRLHSAVKNANTSSMRLNARLLEATCTGIGAEGMVVNCQEVARLAGEEDEAALKESMSELNKEYALVKDIVLDMAKGGPQEAKELPSSP